MGAAIAALTFAGADAADPQIERGQYLTNFGGCFDCHTSGYFFGQPAMDRYLGGSDVGFEIPGLGVFVGPNLTPDKETGLGTGLGRRRFSAAAAQPSARLLIAG